MRWRVVQGGWAVVLRQGDDVLESVRQVAREAGIRSAALSGLGAVAGVQIAYWDQAERQYLRVDLDGDLEIGALVGNVTLLEGQPFVHAHAVLGGRDFLARTGHLMAAKCAATVEIFLHDYGSAVHRRADPEIGLNLCEL
jgi:hypothetical protein